MNDTWDPCEHEKDAMGKTPRDPQEGRMSFKCWRCGGPHLHWIFPHEERYVRPAYNTQCHGADIVGKEEQESFPDATVTIRILRIELQDCKEENKRLVKAMVEQNQLITTILQNVADFQRQIKSGHQLTEAEGSRKNSHKKNEKLKTKEERF